MVFPALLGFLFFLSSHKKFDLTADRDSVSGRERILGIAPHLAVAVVLEHDLRMIQECRGRDSAIARHRDDIRISALCQRSGTMHAISSTKFPLKRPECR